MGPVAPPPIVYRFEPRLLNKHTGERETWQQYITFACSYFKFSVFARTQAIAEYEKYVKDGVDQFCAGYIVLRESGLYDKMKADVAKHRPHRAEKNM